MKLSLVRYRSMLFVQFGLLLVDLSINTFCDYLRFESVILLVLFMWEFFHLFYSSLPYGNNQPCFQNSRCLPCILTHNCLPFFLFNIHFSSKDYQIYFQRRFLKLKSIFLPGWFGWGAFSTVSSSNIHFHILSWPIHIVSRLESSC